MAIGELNEQILCGLGTSCHSVQCNDGGLDCDTTLCVVDRDEGEEPGFYGHGRESISRRLNVEDSFKLAEETECKVTSYNHINLDNAVRYPYEETGPYERIKSGTVSMGNEIFFYGGYKLYPGTHVEFDRRGDISGLTLTLRGVNTKFLGIDWPVGTKIAMRGDAIDVYLNTPMAFDGLFIDFDAKITFEKRDGKTFRLATISAMDAIRDWKAEIGGVKFKDIDRIEFDFSGHIQEVWGKNVTVSDKTPGTIEGFLEVKFQNGKVYSITPQNSRGTALDGFGLFDTVLPFGSIIKFGSDHSVSSIVALGMGLEGEKATICGKDYDEPIEVWFGKDGLPDGHVRYFKEKPTLVYEHYPIHEGISIGDDQTFAYGNEFWFGRNEEGFPQYEEISSVLLSRDQWLISPGFVDHLFFPKGTRLWLDGEKIIAAKLANGTTLGTVAGKSFLPADSIVFFEDYRIPCALLEKSGHLYDITSVLDLGVENAACLSSAFALSPLPL
jgi:hypothetical protein